MTILSSDELERVEVARNTDRADKIIAWIEKNLKVTIGSKKIPVGSPYLLAEFQKQFIRDIYEPYDVATPDERLISKAVFSVGRKNGKSDLSAALVLVHLIGPESETNGWIVSGAKSLRQARMVFEAAVRFLNLSPALKAHVRIVDSKSTIAVTSSGKRCSGSKYQAIASDKGSAQGLNPSVVIMDELAQAQDGGQFFRSLEIAAKARANPLTIVISTQAASPVHIMSVLVEMGLQRRPDTDCQSAPNRSCIHCARHQRTISHLYAAPEGCSLTDREALRSANPAIGLWLNENDMIAELLEAAEAPASEVFHRLYTLNQQVSLFTTLVSAMDWKAITTEGPAIKDRWQHDVSFAERERIWIGLDMSARADLTALVAIGESGLIKAWFFKPAAMVAQHTKTDDEPYDFHRDRGWLTTPPGRSMDAKWVVHQIKELHERYDIRGIAYDRRLIDAVLIELDSEDLLVSKEGEAGEGIKVVPFAQGPAGMEPAISRLYHLIVHGEISHDGNPILRNNMMNAVVKADASGFRMFDKEAARFRIDGAVALAMAVGLRDREITTTPAAKSWFEDPEFQYPFA